MAGVEHRRRSRDTGWSHEYNSSNGNQAPSSRKANPGYRPTLPSCAPVLLKQDRDLEWFVKDRMLEAQPVRIAAQAESKSIELAAVLRVIGHRGDQQGAFRVGRRELHLRRLAA